MLIQCDAEPVTINMCIYSYLVSAYIHYCAEIKELQKGVKSMKQLWIEIHPFQLFIP